MARQQSKPKAKAPALVGISTRVPPELWTRVKTYCAKGQITVQELIVGLLAKAMKQ